jgi:carbon monoxide dehydrogenase subunit G
VNLQQGPGERLRADINLLYHFCMQLTGKHVVNASPSKVWDILMNTDTLARIVPGISRLEKTGDNSFKSILEIKMGPVNSSFTGDLEMEDIVPQSSYTLKVQQNSKIGNANAVIRISLAPSDENKTEVGFNGDVKLSGMLAALGQRLVGGVSDTLTKQFFTNLEREVAKESAAP